jgi:hypothetical protein
LRNFIFSTYSNKKSLMKNLLLPLLLAVFSVGLNAQLDVFNPANQKRADLATHEQRITPNSATYFQVNAPSALATALAKAPSENNFAAGEELLLTLPNPDGKKSTFRITRYQTLNDDLQATFPSFVTAYGWDVAAPYRRVFLEWTEFGFAASVTGGEEGRWYISPTFWQQTDHYQSYYTRDYPASRRNSSCGFEPNEALRAELEAFGPATKSVGDCALREYDLAIACTGEYFARVGGTEAAVISEIMTAINRVNGVFRSDLAITLKIINLPTPANGVQLLFDDPTTDPYTNSDGDLMLDENQTTVDNTIGSANYDIGHVFSTGGGGIASLGSPCNATRKAQGVTGLPNPIGDPFYIDFVAHEIGHQFGGNHTFNSTEENCVQRNGPTGYEPGGGTTIQAYAGICGPTANIQQNSEAYYHAVSIQEISAYMELGGGAGCATQRSTANTEPTVSAGANYTIPTNTPFVLTAENGADGNGDGLTYCWEQFDLGPVVAGEPTGNEASGPLFRSKFPISSPERYFPSLPSVVSGTTSWESLPLVARTMDFIVTIRDFGAAGYGCTVQDETTVTVVNTGSRYAVTSPNGGEMLSAGATETITWDVAGTDANGINCSTVELFLSTDGGLSFSQSLGTFPNAAGSAAVTLPSTSTNEARIMVRCADNIFYDISDEDFAIMATGFTLTGNMDELSICSDVNEATFTVDVTSTGGFTGSVDLSITSGLPAGATTMFSTDPVVFTAGNANTTQTITVTIGNLSGAAPNTYTIAVLGDDGTETKSTDLTLNYGAGPITILTPEDNSLQLVNEDVDFSFLTIDGRNRYIISFEIFRGTTSISTGNFGTIFGGSGPGAGQTVNLSETLGSTVGDEVRWMVTASDDSNTNPSVVSCSRSYILANALPVNWLNFTAQPSGKAALLNWSVEQDALNAGFAIERTTPHLNNWGQVGYAQRVGPDGIANYQFTDEQVQAGNTYNYRLRQEDVDGTTSYSEIRTVTFGAVIGLSVVPNPANDFALLNTGADAQENLRYALYDPAGRKVAEGLLNGGRARLNLSQLPAAIYQVLVTDNAGYREVARVVKR